MKNLRLKLKALTPIHIGTGEVYEPTNYVIDDGYLYEFDEVLFLKHLPSSKRTEFIRYVEASSEHGYELFEKIHHFIVANKQYAKEVAFNRVVVSKTLETKYKNDIAKKVQIEKKKNSRFSRSVFNKFEIQKTQRLLNRATTYISGSSLKGAISTAYQEYIYNEKGRDGLKQYFDVKGDKLFRNLSISDTIAQKATAKIAYAVNKERFEEDSSEISTMLEVNEKGSEYLLSVDIKTLLNDNGEKIDEVLSQEKIIQVCNNHYKPIYKDKENKELKLSVNQFIISVGKHSGARAVTIDGIRKILVKLAQIQNKKEEGDNANIRIERLHKKSHFESSKISELFANEKFLDEKEKKVWQNGVHFIENPSVLEGLIQNRQRVTINAYLTEETTIWRFSEHNKDSANESFGWVLCEFIEESEYQTLFKEFKLFEENLIEQKTKQQQKALDKIEQSKKEAHLSRERIEKELRDEANNKAQKEAEEKDRLASMNPLEQKIEALSKNEPNIPKITLLLKAIKNGNFDEEKCEALKVLKLLMKKDKKWKDESTKKNPKKDKDYNNTLEVMSMLNECNLG